MYFFMLIITYNALNLLNYEYLVEYQNNLVILVNNNNSETLPSWLDHFISRDDLDQTQIICP